MSEDFKDRIQKLKTEELVEFALEHLGKENESLRKASLQEHWSRIKEDPNTIVAPPGDTLLLKAKLSELIPPASV